MPAPDAISCDKLAKLIGTSKSPQIFDLRDDAILLIPGARSVDRHSLISEDAGSIVVVCAHGGADSQGAAALLRSKGMAAEYLEGGYQAWEEAHLPVFDGSKLTCRDEAGRSLWVTRARPKIDRIACPWLIRRFIDPRAVFLYVSPSEVLAVAERLGAAPFDVEAAFWSHDGDRCTFDKMIAEFGLNLPALDRLATIVRGADTARPDLAPECAGLIAASLGLSRMFTDDLAQLEAGMGLYDAFYRWARDATGETHNWPANKVTT
ncbi:chromate resistance protein ChrB domain-containing protein [Falsirhodobacter sp. 1013]|uniref:chromate resistance protein ChrB domain-containing protein n=1 Tax=Falsirhodobacter sp. 1013 TaxID=3417566 RepID=UPI003EC12A44